MLFFGYVSFWVTQCRETSQCASFLLRSSTPSTFWHNFWNDWSSRLLRWHFFHSYGLLLISDNNFDLRFWPNSNIACHRSFSWRAQNSEVETFWAMENISSKQVLSFCSSTLSTQAEDVSALMKSSEDLFCKVRFLNFALRRRKFFFFENPRHHSLVLNI